MKNGKFITFEGCEGAGKSTQIRLLSDYLSTHGIRALFTREPGGTVIAEKIRSIILTPTEERMHGLTELLLYEASRAQHLAHVIKPALARGETVICDRFCDSTVAYQVFARGLPRETVDTLNRIACGGLEPDCTVFLDVPPDAGFKRKGGADKGDRIETETGGFHDKVYAGYKSLAAEHPDRIISVGHAGDKKQVHAEIIAALQKRGVI